MKKMLVLLAVFCLSLPVLADDRPIDVNNLPAAAREFISGHFAHTSVNMAWEDKEIMDTEYKVRLADGTEIKFNKDGQWKEIEAKQGSVPAAALPEAIRMYINNNHPNRVVKEIDRDRRDYEVKLDNGMELKFDNQFRLIEIDR